MEEQQGFESPPMYTPENTVDNLVAQIDPKQIIDNLDHALKGEIYNKETGMWILNPSGRPIVNDECRGAVVSYITGILNNNTTMAIISEKQLSYVMESIIETITRMFVVNLERFGFVPPGKRYNEGIYENKGTPDSAKMTKVANMIYSVMFLTLSRALGGMESKKIFNSLSMTDAINYGREMGKNDKKGWISKVFGG